VALIYIFGDEATTFAGQASIGHMDDDAEMGPVVKAAYGPERSALVELGGKVPSRFLGLSADNPRGGWKRKVTQNSPVNTTCTHTHTHTRTHTRHTTPTA
jgi:hypothetical protein